MTKMANMTKICKYCKTEIPKDAKICPNCRKKQKGPLGLIIAGVVAVLVIGSVAGGGSGSESSSAKTEEKSRTTVSKEVTEKATEVPKEYIAVTKQKTIPLFRYDLLLFIFVWLLVFLIYTH